MREAKRWWVVGVRCTPRVGEGSVSWTYLTARGRHKAGRKAVRWAKLYLEGWRADDAFEIEEVWVLPKAGRRLTLADLWDALSDRGTIWVLRPH